MVEPGIFLSDKIRFIHRIGNIPSRIRTKDAIPIMGIASRLFRIVKANLQRDRYKANPDPMPFDMPFPKGSSPPNEPHRDPLLAKYYGNLEIPYGSDLETVKTAWKKLMRKYHPDLHGNDPERRSMAEELTQALNLAYKELEKHLKSQ